MNAAIASAVSDRPTGADMTGAIDNAFAQTARNPAAFPAFSGTFSDPPTQAEMQAFAAYVESMRQGISR